MQKLRLPTTTAATFESNFGCRGTSLLTTQIFDSPSIYGESILT